MSLESQLARSSLTPEKFVEHIGDNGCAMMMCGLIKLYTPEDIAVAFSIHFYKDTKIPGDNEGEENSFICDGDDIREATLHLVDIDHWFAKLYNGVAENNWTHMMQQDFYRIFNDLQQGMQWKRDED